MRCVDMIDKFEEHIVLSPFLKQNLSHWTHIL